MADQSSKQAVKEHTFSSGSWSMALCAALLLLCAWGATVARLPNATRFWNFGYIHDGSLCFQDRCDPYDTRLLDSLAQRHHERARPVLNPEYPVYPPSTLLLFVPLNPLGWPGSGLAFFAFSLLAYGGAVTAMVRSVRHGPWLAGSIVLLALLSSGSPWEGLYYGNPVMPCAGLMTAACVFLLSPERRHDSLAVALLALALCLKPQLAIGAVIFLLWRSDTRKAAWSASLIFVVFSVLATVLYAWRLGGFAYLSTEMRILQLGFQPGHSSDGSLRNPFAFRFLNLEPLMSEFSFGPRAAKTAALAVTVFMGGLLFRIGRTATVLKQRPWTMLSLVILLSCMPLYHREYDRCLLLAIAPAAMEAELSSRLRWLIPLAALLLFWSEPLIPMLLPFTLGFPMNAALALILFGLLLWSLNHGRSPQAADAEAIDYATNVPA